MQILSTAGCLRRIEKNCILAATELAFILPFARCLVSRSRRTKCFAEWRCAASYSTFFSRSSSFFLPSPAGENHPGDRAETHRNYCPTKLINYAGMDRAVERARERKRKRKREREGAGRKRAFFSVAIAASAFTPAAFLSPLLVLCALLET